jgi:hypothetical protein
MESKIPSPARVKKFTGKISKKKPLRLDRRRWQLYIRLRGWLRGCFAQPGMDYKIWTKEVFSATSGYSVRHLERAFPQFARWCTEFTFEKVHHKGTWRIKVTQNFGVRPRVHPSEVKKRLEAAIASVANQIGTAKVDAEFLRRFCEISRLPGEMVSAVWQRMKNLPGFRCRWRGVGAGRKFLVSSTSLTQTSRVISSPSGRREKKQCAANATLENAQTKPPLAALASQGPLNPDRSDTQKSPSFFQPSPAMPPLQICGRWVSGRKLLAKAIWISVVPLKNVHAQWERVVWRFAHTRNFAYRALRAGYAADVIVRAYARGCGESHEDALDRDRLPGGGFASQREPSAAVVYGWRELRAVDARPAADRWAEFFAAPRKKMTVAAAKPRARPAGETSGARLSAAEAAAELKRLRQVIAKPLEQEDRDDVVKLTAGELLVILRARHMSLADFGSLSWRHKWAIINAARRARENKK